MRQWINIISESISEHLNERHVMHGALRIPVLENPTATQMIDFCNRARDNDVRGLMVDKDVYWWEAYLGTHHGIAHLLNVEYNVDKRLYFQKNELGEYQISAPDLFGENLIKHPQINRVTQNPTILLYNGSTGWQTGKETLEQMALNESIITESRREIDQHMQKYKNFSFLR